MANYLFMKKVAVFHWGSMTVHTFYLVEELKKQNIKVDLFIYTPHYSRNLSFDETLLNNIKETSVVFEFKPERKDIILLKLNKLLKTIGFHSSLLCINPLLPKKTMKILNQDNYDYLISIAQSSLYWLYKSAPKALNKILHYSLEIRKTTDREIQKNSCLYSLIRKEETILKKIGGLIIQDNDRAAALLNNNMDRKALKIICMPVSIPGNILPHKSSYLHVRLSIPKGKMIVLYFGMLFHDRKIDNLVEAFEKLKIKKYVLVLHGDDYSHLIKKDSSAVLATEGLLPFDEIHKLITSATIGIAFYDNATPNNRLTAFSSEKIARYAQAGVPFLAIKNDNYIRLRNEFLCCELIEDFSEIEGKLSLILENYEEYRQNCFVAYDKYFNLEKTIMPLAALINS